MKSVVSAKKVRGWRKYLRVEYHPNRGPGGGFIDRYVYIVPDDTEVPDGCELMTFAEALARNL